MTWSDVKLDDLFRVGSSKRVLKSQWQAEGVPFYRGREVTRLSKDGFVDNELFISEELFKEYSEKYGVPSVGDIVITAIGTIGNTHIVRNQDRFYFKDASVLWLKKTSDVSSEFINYWIKSPLMREQLDEGNGATVDTLTIKKLQSLKVKLPPLPEQQRIVAILDEAFAGIDAAIANTEKNLANARELFESYLQKIFNQHGEGWEVKPLESFSNIVNGYAFKSGDFSPQNEVKSIKITNVGVYEFVQESDNYLPKNFLEEYGRYKAYEGDVVVALTRTIISSGLKVAVVPAEYDGALINQRVAAVQVDEDVMPKQILQAFLSTKMAIDYVRSNVNELMQPNLSIKDLKAFPIPVPPADQVSSVSNQIAEIREKKDQLVALYVSKIDSLNELKQSLLQKAFSGELTAEGDKLMDEAVA